MHTVCPVLARIGATADVVVGQAGAAQVQDDVVNATVHRGPYQVHLVVVRRVPPHAAREDVGPDEQALWEDAAHGAQVLLDRCQEVRGALGTQVVAAQVHDEHVRVGPLYLKLVEQGKQLGPRHTLGALPVDHHVAGVHAQLHAHLWGLGPRLGPVHQGVATDPHALGLADWITWRSNRSH